MRLRRDVTAPLQARKTTRAQAHGPFPPATETTRLQGRVCPFPENSLPPRQRRDVLCPDPAGTPTNVPW